MKAESSQGIPATSQALLGAFAGAIHGGIIGGFAIARFGSGQPLNLKDGKWVLAATVGIWFCLSVGLGVNKALNIVTGTLAGSVVGVVVGLATGTNNGTLFGAMLGAVVGGVFGANANRTPLKDKPSVDVYDRDMDG